MGFTKWSDFSLGEYLGKKKRSMQALEKKKKGQIQVLIRMPKRKTRGVEGREGERGRREEEGKKECEGGYLGKC